MIANVNLAHFTDPKRARRKPYSPFVGPYRPHRSKNAKIPTLAMKLF